MCVVVDVTMVGYFIKTVGRFYRMLFSGPDSPVGKCTRVFIRLYLTCLVVLMLLSVGKKLRSHTLTLAILAEDY
jgi:hypothetical protein